MKQLVFPRGWMDANRLEESLVGVASPLYPGSSGDCLFVFPANCKVMIDSALRLLALCNQLDLAGRSVDLDFEEGGLTFGYLNRVGFFDHLREGIQVRPQRPLVSGADIYRGNNPGVVEIESIEGGRKDRRDDALLTRLTTAVADACDHRDDVEELTGAVWTIFAELIDNVYEHSQTPLEGHAALQVFANGNALKVVVSDSGLGILETLRPALAQERPTLSSLSDLDLLLEIFRSGVSRHGRDRGCGLWTAAKKALKFQGTLDLRLPRVRIVLSPGVQGYSTATARCYDEVADLEGTHLCFNFPLDTTG